MCTKCTNLYSTPINIILYIYVVKLQLWKFLFFKNKIGGKFYMCTTLIILCIIYVYSCIIPGYA